VNRLNKSCLKLNKNRKIWENRNIVFKQKTMKLKPKTTIEDHFSPLKDPRMERTKRHKLIDIVIITICAVISGADDWVSIALYGCAKYEWFQQFLELPNGIPSHDTFARVFARIDPKQFQECFINWIKSVDKKIPEEVIAVDGKTLRSSYDNGGEKGAIHMVSAWATEKKLVLGQRKVDDKSNEITAIPELLKILELEGYIVTMDAMGCQREIVKLITNKSADYVIALKQNQGNLYEEVVEIFKQVIRERNVGYKYDTFEIETAEHGRKERRSYMVLNNISDQITVANKWTNLNSIVMIEYLREEDGKTKIETRYYISSLTKNGEEFAKIIRSHWQVENSLHWVLDVQFNEDKCRIRKDHSAENLAVVRHIALNLLKQDKSVKVGIKNKRFLAGIDENYLMNVLARI